MPLANMLVLSRKVGEKILIGDSISITVVRISGGGVRIGIEAPTDMPVVREELATDIENRNPSKAPVLHQENGVKDSVIGTDPNNTFDSETPSQPR